MVVVRAKSIWIVLQHGASVHKEPLQSIDDVFLWLVVFMHCGFSKCIMLFDRAKII